MPAKAARHGNEKKAERLSDQFEINTISFYKASNRNTQLSSEPREESPASL